jgi:hypothetical protein
LEAFFVCVDVLLNNKFWVYGGQLYLFYWPVISDEVVEDLFFGYKLVI